MSESIRVSVVVPVYNAEPFLSDFVESFLAQSLSAGEAELVAVDDGSTDRSGEILDELAVRYSNIRVIHQENSGWPGRPRNVGTDASLGTYVFYADPDDQFGGAKALEKLADFADEHDSDVIVPRMVGRGGRRYGQWRYETTQIDADLVTCFAALTPQKLFRRSLLVEQGIRFPEEKVRLEDGQFLSRAYLQAKRVSILSGYKFYYLTKHENQSHLTGNTKEPVSYIGSVAKMSENVERYCDDEELADAIINLIYFRKVLGNFASSRLLNHSRARLEKWVQCQQSFIGRFITERRYTKLDEAGKARTDLVVKGDLDAIVDFAKVGRADFDFENVRTERGVVELQGSIIGRDDGTENPELVITARGDEDWSVHTPFEPEDGSSVAKITKAMLPASSAEKRYNLWVKPGYGHLNKRLRGPEAPFSVRFTDNRLIEVYTTKSGNLSVIVNKGLPVHQRVMRTAKRALRGRTTHLGSQADA